MNGAIAWAQIAAHLAFIRHPGFYASPPLENLLLKIAGEIGNAPEKSLGVNHQRVGVHNSGKMHFLHVVTELYGSGGHSAFIGRWIKNTLDNSVHSLISTANSGKLPELLESAIGECGGWHCSAAANSEDLVGRALFLRRLANNWADVIVLFTHPFDPIPTVTFGVSGGPPIIFCNHADHAFWLGVSISDVFADYHSSGGTISKNRRGIKKTKILPIPLVNDSNNASYDNLRTRKSLGLKDDELMLLSVARDEKFLPYDGYDYFDFMVNFLKKNPKVKLFAVGPPHAGRWIEASTLVDGRIQALGPLDRASLDELFTVADVYVPSFPCGSGTALLEACAHGVPAVGLQVNDLPFLTGQDDVSFTALPVHEATVNKLQDSLIQAITKPKSSKERAVNIRMNIIREHCPPGWNSYLNNILQSLPTQHKVKKLRAVSTKLDTADLYLANLDFQMLSQESINHTFSRLVRVYSRYLPKVNALSQQAKSLLEALPQVSDTKEGKQFLYNLRKLLGAAFQN